MRRLSLAALAALMTVVLTSAVDEALRQRIDPIVDRGDDWLVSRLQMNWNTHATDAYVRGDFLDHFGGDPAPVPTVKMSGARSHVTRYARPRLEDVAPYDDDPRGMLLANNALEGRPMEWAAYSQTGNIIQSINQEVLSRALDAATLWQQTGHEKYARVASRVLDTYLLGILHRNVPRDLNHGHIGTLVGFASFEVIHDNILSTVCQLYVQMKSYMQRHYAASMPLYADALSKWADLIIANGVPHNNWDILQARLIMDVALVLDHDGAYADGKGQEYYRDCVIHRNSIRQWSLTHLASYGYDAATGQWAECAGYSQVVLNDFTAFVTLFDERLGHDLLEDIPVLRTAVLKAPQLLYPDRMTLGFGDTHPGPLNRAIFDRMEANALLHGRTADATLFAAARDSLLTEGASVDWLVTPTFHAPNASWLVMRNGMDRHGSLMATLNGSQGNHTHANGISLELYGKGLRLGPDAGIGYSLYSGDDYKEYYSQFPAHNTVCVDGVSNYPVMMGTHPFEVLHCQPQPGADVPYPDMSYASLRFLEPETQSDQQRTTALVTTGPATGYYVDIFRSRKREGGDRTHDYFYHNMGQHMTLTAADGSDLGLQATDELAFAGGHLYAYSYIYDKESAATPQDIRATFTVSMPDGDDVTMTMWMKGEPDRTVFKALSPSTEGLSRLRDMPYDIASQGTLTFVARQQGEAWTRPFVAVYEPSTAAEPPLIQSVTYPAPPSPGTILIEVTLRDGRRDLLTLTPDAVLTLSRR